MPDIVDFAQDLETRERAAALSAVRASLDGPGPLWIGEKPTCRECGESIPFPRVKAMPGTGFCIECAKEAESEKHLF